MSETQSINLFAPGFRIVDEIIYNDERYTFSDAEWSRTGRSLALLSEKEGAGFYLWHEHKKSLQYIQVGYFAGVSCLSLAFDDKLIAVGCIDGTIQILSAQKEECISQFITDGRVQGITWLSKQNSIATIHNGGLVYIWDVIDKSYKQYKISGNFNKLVNFVVSPNGKRIAANCGTGQIHIINSENGELSLLPHDGYYGPVSSLDWSQTNKFIATGAWSKTICILDATNGRLIKELWEPQGKLLKVRFSPDARFLAATAEDNIIRLWRCDTWVQVAQIPELGGGTNRVLAFHPTKPMLAVGAEGGHKVRLWQYDPNILGG